MDALRTTAGRLVAIAVLGLVAALLPVLTPTPALADAGLEQQFVASINAERAGAGLSALTPAGDLTTAARRHAQTMGSADHLHHNPNLGSAVGGWEKLGENVGRGPGVGVIHQAFMDSPGHRRNVLDPAFTEVGIGVIVVDGQIWVTEMFRLPTGAAAPAPAAPAEAEPAAPAPAPATPEPTTDPVPATPAAAADATGDGEAAADDAPARDGEAARDDAAAGTAADPVDDATAPSGPPQGERMLHVQLRVAAHDA